MTTYATDPNQQTGALLPTTNYYGIEPWNTLLCPQCGSDYTHVDEVTMKAAGDQLAVTLTGSGEDGNSHIGITHGDLDGRPGRRHTMVIRISCEDGCVTDLELAQHKGNTYTMIRPIIHTPAT